MLYININIKDINVYMHIQMLMSFSFQSYNSFPLVYVFMVHIVYLHGCTIILLTLDDPYLVNKWIILFYWFDMSKIRISKFLPHINIKPLLLFQLLRSFLNSYEHPPPPTLWPHSEDHSWNKLKFTIPEDAATKVC